MCIYIYIYIYIPRLSRSPSVSPMSFAFSTFEYRILIHIRTCQSFAFRNMECQNNMSFALDTACRILYGFKHVIYIYIYFYLNLLNTFMGLNMFCVISYDIMYIYIMYIVNVNMIDSVMIAWGVISSSSTSAMPWRWRMKASPEKTQTRLDQTRLDQTRLNWTRLEQTRLEYNILYYIISYYIILDQIRLYQTKRPPRRPSLQY